MPGPSTPGIHEPLPVGPVYGTVSKAANVWHIIVRSDGAGPGWCGKQPIQGWYYRVRGEGEGMRVCATCRRRYEETLR